MDEGANLYTEKCLKTYTNNLSVDYEEISVGKMVAFLSDLFFDKLDDSVGAVVFQNLISLAVW